MSASVLSAVPARSDAAELLVVTFLIPARTGISACSLRGETADGRRFAGTVSARLECPDPAADAPDPGMFQGMHI